MIMIIIMIGVNDYCNCVQLYEKPKKMVKYEKLLEAMNIISRWIMEHYTKL